MKNNFRKIVLITSGLFLAFLSCKNPTKDVKNEAVDMTLSEEKLYRPNVHFTPNKNWMNDPNGMFYLNGKYHLYFQYYPDGNVWGPMHWGHAISEDLVSWKEQPIAIYPDSLGYIFSGSAVVDTKNTSGFGKDGITPVIAIFTYHNMESEKAGNIDYQSQAIAYSLDEGQTWTKYDQNPVIPNPGIKDFRDPKVTWDEFNEQWLMALATIEKTLFYSSKNLKDWKLISDFGQGIGAHEGVWECPDFFPMKVEGTNEVKWVLLQSLNPGGLHGGSGTQYFIGDFDGVNFVLDEKFAEDVKEKDAIWLDFGKDNYAGVTWSNIPESDGRKLFMGWMSNWEYATVVPTEQWRSSMTIARELTLVNNQGKYRLLSNPVSELNNYKKEVHLEENTEYSGGFNLIPNGNVDVNKAVIELDLAKLSKDNYEFILSNDSGDALLFGINNIENYYYIDRRNSGNTDFSEKFAAKISTASFESTLENVQIQIIIDKTSIEIFYNHGETVMTEIFFPKAPFQSLKLNTIKSSEIIVNKLRVSQLEFNN